MQNDYIQQKIDLTLIEEKMTEIQLRWFGYVQTNAKRCTNHKNRFHDFQSYENGKEVKKGFGETREKRSHGK